MSVRDRLKVRPEPRQIRRAVILLVCVPFLLMAGEALIRARIDSLDWDDAVARVYARPVTLVRGGLPDREAVRGHLQRLGYQRARGENIRIGEYHFGSRGWIVGKRPFRGPDGVEPAGFMVIYLDYSGRISRIEDEDGRRLSEASLEPELIGRVGEGQGGDRIPVRLDEVPDDLVGALLTVEDQRFFQHNGLDFRRIGAAFAANLKAGRVVQGGSTLTQQLVKNLFLSPRRSIIRKIREALMASVLEGRHDKEEILQAYLNQVYLAQDRGVAIHGVGRAAEFFFGKDITSLELPESALLVALIRAPSAYSPFRNPETALARRNLVLRLLRDRDAITEEEYQRASKASLGLRKRTDPSQGTRYFLDHVASAGLEGDILHTTLDAGLQRAAEAAVEAGLAQLERRYDWLEEGEDGEPLQAALVALDPHSGDILAMVGGRDYQASQFNRATGGRRQPGSAFKPVVAMAALARTGLEPTGSVSPVRSETRSDGRLFGTLPRFTLATVLEDRPFQVETPVGLWEPANYDRSFSGRVTLREALERSLNVPFARLGMEVGPERIVEVARAFGIESDLKPFPSLALGASEVTPLELTRAFGVLAAGGFRADSRLLLNGSVSGTQAFDPAEAFLVTSALQGAVQRGTGRGIRGQGFHGELAAKSGTTNDFRDGWFVGYTPELVVGVWVGFDHGKRLELPGAGVAMPIFAAFMKGAVGQDGRSGTWGGDGFSYPSGLEMASVDPSSGLRGGWGCPGEPEIFLRGSAPTESCAESRWGNGARLDSKALRFLLEQEGEDLTRVIRRLLRGEGRN